MKDPTNLAGVDPVDRRLWNSYVFWARNCFGTPPSTLMISDPDDRISPEKERLLHSLVFSTFALEYRLHSVYETLGLAVRKGDGLWKLLENLERRTNGTRRNGTLIVFPDEWKEVRVRLQRLLELRNKIAHGQRGPVTALLGETEPSLAKQAVDGYNAVIDAIRIINVAIAYDTKTGDALSSYYAQLQVCDTDGAELTNDTGTGG